MVRPIPLKGNPRIKRRFAGAFDERSSAILELSSSSTSSNDENLPLPARRSTKEISPPKQPSPKKAIGMSPMKNPPSPSKRHNQSSSNDSQEPKERNKEVKSRDNSNKKHKSPGRPKVSVPGPKRVTQPKQPYRPSALVLKEIKRLQADTNNQIPRASFGRVCREITGFVARRSDIRYSVGALLALQDAAEAYIIGLMEDSYLISLHAKRVTLMDRDMKLARRIRGDFM